MATILDRAKLALSDLSEDDQNALVEQLEEAAATRKLKAMIAEGQASLARGEGVAFDIERIIRDGRRRHAGAL